MAKTEKKTEAKVEVKVDPTDAFISRRLKAINNIPNKALARAIAEKVLLSRKGK